MFQINVFEIFILNSIPNLVQSFLDNLSPCVQLVTHRMVYSRLIYLERQQRQKYTLALEIIYLELQFSFCYNTLYSHLQNTEVY
jgi:hypothetical protein